MTASQQKGKIFTLVVFTNCPKDEKNVKQVMERTLNKALFIIPPNLTCSFRKKNPNFNLVRLVSSTVVLRSLLYKSSDLNIERVRTKPTISNPLLIYFG